MSKEQPTAIEVLHALYGLQKMLGQVHKRCGNRESQLAIDKLQEGLMWINQAFPFMAAAGEDSDGEGPPKRWFKTDEEHKAACEAYREHGMEVFEFS